MTTKRLSGLVAVVLIVLLASCGKKAPGYTQYIPKDANYVVGIDVRSVLEKLEKDSLSVENIMAAFKEEGSSEKYTKAVETYKQFKDAGIDWSNRVYVTFSLGGNMMGGSGNVASEMVAGMKDAGKFEAFLKQQPQTKDIKKGDGFSYTGDNEHTIGWNDDAVIVLYTKNVSSNDYMPDSLSGMSKPQSESNATASADLLKKYFKQAKSESIVDADGFGDLQGQKADVTMYSQTGNINLPFFAGMPKIKDLLKGYSTSTINFEDGKVVTESSAHLSKELADLLKKYAGPEVDMSLVENYPSSNVDGVMAFSFKPEIIPGLLDYLSAKGAIDMQLGNMGLTTDELAKFFKGDFAVVVSDFGIAQNTVAGKDAMTSVNLQPTAKMIFAARLGDKAVVEKVLKLAQEKGFLVRNGNSLMPNPQMTGNATFPFVVSIANNTLVFASDSTTFNAYQAKTQKIALPTGVESTLKGKAISGYMDVQKILAGISPNMFDSSDASQQVVLGKAKATFKDGWYTVGNLSGSTIESKAELNFMDDKKNSLAQIVRFGMFAYEQTKAQRAADAKEWESMPTDTTVMAAPADTLVK